MGRFFLIVAFAASGQAFLFPKLCELLHVELPRFLTLTICLPAVALGIQSWFRTRSFARSWPVGVCVLIIWVGLLHTRQTQSQRGLLMAYNLTMILPVAALIDEHRHWWACAKAFVISSVVALLLAGWFEYDASGGRIFNSLVRFGRLMSEDGSTRLANPNPVGGQFAFAAILALVLYLKSYSSQRQGPPSAKSTGHFLAWAVLLSVGAFLTGSRGAFVSWFAGAGLLLLFGTKHLPTDKLRDLVAFACMLLSVGMMTSISGSFVPWAPLYERTFGEKSETVGSLGSRTEVWKHAWHAWLSDPKHQYFGTGTGTACEVLGEQVLRESQGVATPDDEGVLQRNAHSAYVEWGLSYGIVGALAGLLLMGTMFYKAHQLDLRQGGVNRLAILVCFTLFAATIVVYWTAWWFAPGALILAMLTDPPAAGASAARRVLATSAPAAPVHASAPVIQSGIAPLRHGHVVPHHHGPAAGPHAVGRTAVSAPSGTPRPIERKPG